MYTSNKRVIREGYLIAYEGEEMSDEEAKNRGLLKNEKPKTKRVTQRKKAADAETPDDVDVDGYEDEKGHEQ